MHIFFRLFNFFEKKKKENFQKFSLQKTQFLTYIILKSIESMENPLRIQAPYSWFSLCPEFIFSSCSLARFVYRSRAKEGRQKKRKDLSEPGIRHRGKGMYEWRIWSELKSVLRGIIEEGNISIDVRFIDHAKWPTRRTCHFAGVILSFWPPSF